MSKHFGKQRKRLGQNYLNDPNLVDELIELINIKPGDVAIEPGAGEGSITSRLLDKGCLVTAIELDKGNCKTLRSKYSNEDSVDLYCGDVLGFRPPKFDYKLFGNPPFGITSKIIKHFLLSSNSPSNFGLIMQAQAAERLIGTYENSLVSIKLQSLYAFQDLIDIKPSAFTPRPSVEVVFLTGKKYGADINETKLFFSFVDSVYTRSQGTIRGNLKKWLSNLQVKRLGQDFAFDPKASIISLNLTQWQGIYVFYKSL